MQTSLAANTFSESTQGGDTVMQDHVTQEFDGNLMPFIECFQEPKFIKDKYATYATTKLSKKRSSKTDYELSKVGVSLLDKYCIQED